MAGTLIHTDKGFIPIEDVMPGDEVLTHTNNYKKVLEVGCRPNAPILKIKGMCFKDIICTPNHPFYVRERYRYGHKRERRFKNPEWIEAKDLNKNHFLGYAINQNSSMPKWAGIVATRWKKEENRLSALFEKTSFWYLMGRYVGDGWKRDSKTGNGVIICCSDRNRTSLFKAIEDCGFNAVSVKERTVEKLFICMNELYSFVDRYGYYAHGKYIDEETINLPIPLLEAFVNGYIDSDGCYTQNEYKTITVSERLAYGMQQCISKVYKCPVRLYFCKRKEDTIIEGRKVNQRDTYSLVWHKERRKQDTAFYENGYVWFPINEITHLNESASVYNMEVEEDNSYTANGAIVHNCQDISNAGLQKGFSEGSGSRSSLLWECEKAIRAKKPKYLMMENVKALVTEKFMPDFKKWISILAEMGYESFWKVLNAKDFGVPQNRERVFMISILNHNGTYHFPKTFKLEKRLKDILEPFVDEKYYLKTEQVQKIVEHCDRKVAEGCGFKTNFQDEDGIAGTITGQYGGRETDTRIKESIGEPEVIQLGNLLPDEEGKFHNPHRGRVYSVDGIAPCQHTCGGGNLEPKILLPYNTAEEGVAPTITTMYARLGTNNLTPGKYGGGMGVVEVKPINTPSEDISGCITAHYHKVGYTDLDPTCKLPHPAIAEIYRDKRLQAMVESGKIDPDKVQYLDTFNQSAHEDVAGCIKARIDQNNAYFITEPTSCASRKRGDEHKIEMGSDIANAVTTINTDSLVAEPTTVIGSMQEHAHVGSVDGVSPCITAMAGSGGGNVPMLLEEPKIIQKVGDRGTDNYSVNDISNTIPANPMSDRGQLLIEPKFLRFGFGHGSQGVSSDVAFAVKASAFEHNNFIVENEEPETKCLNYFDENGEKRSLQDRIYDENGISTAITTSFHPNIAVEEKDGVQYKGEFIKEGDGFDAQKSENYGMNVMDGISPTIRASKHDTSTCVRNGASYRIRKLTEREVFRLMDVSEEDIDKIQSIGIAKTAQYKLAGNSIVVSCMYHLFIKLFVELKNEGQPSLFDDIW